MNKLLCLGLIIIGAILLYYGYSEGASPVGELTEAITGSPPDRSIGKMIAGIVLIVIGGGGMARRTK